MVLLHSSLARVRCASGRNRNNFFTVSSLLAAPHPGAPGYIVADFTPDRNKHLKETLPAFKLLRF